MANNILPKVRRLLPSSFVVHVLAHEGRRYHCGNCGEVMFVRYASGLCPHCFNGRNGWQASEEPCEVPQDVVLAGVLDEVEVDFESVEALATISSAHVSRELGSALGE